MTALLHENVNSLLCPVFMTSPETESFLKTNVTFHNPIQNSFISGKSQGRTEWLSFSCGDSVG